MDIISYILSKKYTDNTVDGLGGIKGAPCTVKSVVDIDGGKRITLEWESNSGVKQTQSFDIMDGEDGANTVAWTQIQQTGTKIAEININGTSQDVYAPQGGGSGGHTIYDENGTALTQENGLQFTGAVSVSDDSVNGRTVVDVEGGGNYYLNTLYSTEEKKIGYWTDGKPLYQKTFTQQLSGITGSIDISALNAEMTLIVDGYYDIGVTNIGLNEWLSNGNYSYTHVNNELTPPYIDCYCTWSNSTITVTLQYTKTTDTPEPNPQTGGVIYLPTIYSEEEREVGVWRDGKPLYQKTLVMNNLNLNTSGTAVDITSLGVDMCCPVYEGSYYIVSGVIRGFARLEYQQPNEVYLYPTVNRTGTTSFITLQYTKTTDTAGSGTWTPSGELAHHYSTNEQVVGTWIDGKPLYQKTIVYTPSGTISSNTTIANVPNAKVMRVTEATAYNSSENRGYTLPDIRFNGGTKFTYDNGDVTLEIINDSWSSSWTFYVTVQYTKTTDV